MRKHSFLLMLATALCFALVPPSQGRAQNLYGSIRGIVKDQTGAVIPGARVSATNVNTGIARQAISGGDGSFEFLNLLVPATYNISIEKSGFQTYASKNIQLNLNQTYVVNATLQVGTATQQVSVQATEAQVDTTSIQLGTTITGRQIVDMPLNGRNWVQLQQLQPGVVAASDDRGSYATNGSQAAQNSYLINGTDDNDLPLNTVLVVPSPDAIAEFRMVTSTLNPEYARNSGAILNAVIKSGTNQFHGDGFEFYRDTSLNTRNFFRPSPDIFHRNQFGGTLGGPIWKNHTFFFFSYQGDRETRPQAGGNVPVFTQDQRNGSFPDIATSSTGSPFPLTGENGIVYPAGTPYATIFPTGNIPTADFNPISSNLIKQYVPLPNVGTDFQFNPVIKGLDDQYITRIDHTFSDKDAIWGYWLWERDPTTQTLPFTGATLPGFAEIDGRHFQQYTLAWNHIFNPTTINEARMGYTRFNYNDVLPENIVAPSSLGFTGISPQYIAGQSVPLISLTGFFDLGFSNNGPQPRIDQTYQASDSLSKIAGRHTLKFGFDMRRFQVFNPFNHDNSGVYDFGGAGEFTTGNPGADFLLGIPDTYAQTGGDVTNARAQEYYSYAQDQFRVTPNLTLTYGVGWSIDTPMINNYHGGHAMPAFRPGQQSALFPGAPVGYVLNGDPGVHAAGTTDFKNFGPRFGFAYSPDWGWLSGGAGKLSIRAGYGIYFNRFEEETALESILSPPYGQSSLGVADAGLSPSFADPWTDIAGRGSIPNKFPFAGPSSNVDFSIFEPMSLSVYDPHVSVPYAENFNLTVERQVGDNTILSLGYVGSTAHRNLIAYELNPGINQAGCAANPDCVANRITQNVNYPDNFRYPGDVFGAIGNVATVGNSNYNSFQASLNRHFSHGIQFLAAYTWSHAMDDGSGYENTGFGGGGAGGFGSVRGSNPFNRKLDYGPSIYDATHRLVVSYLYTLPSVRRFSSFQWVPSRITDGWRITGITTFQSGFPMDVIDSGFRSLACAGYTFYECADVPNAINLPQYADPRTSSFVNTATTSGNTASNANYWFNPNTFGKEAFGTFGNAGRNLLRGPGINNFDFALMKDTRLTESTTIELRFEFYNFFNHTQFDPAGIDTDIGSSTFGRELRARSSRIIQLGGKFYF
ncbi:MAG TPA: carboxypeptidase regulatory-like domain-containing protein [Terriglobia bacterium]|nr:carboxypeptidase regulatory-like domain-containing protein [Terriglobia bacterium]